MGDRVYYYQQKIEVDFYIDEEKTAIQACYSLQNIETKEREVNALLNMAKQLEVNKFLIITKDNEETIQIEDKIIEVIPVWKWLLQS